MSSQEGQSTILQNGVYKMSFNFGEVLTRAWQITWKYKVLWIFGILAGCAQGGGGSGSGGAGGGGRAGNDGNGTNPFPPGMQSEFQRVADWISNNWWAIALVVLFIILLVILFVFLGTVGRIGLIRGTLQAETGAGALAFGTLFSESTPFFWRIFALQLLVALAFVLLFLPLLVVGIVTAGIGFVCLLPIFCLLIPVGIAVNMILEQAYVAIVKENLGIIDGWRRGWGVVRANFGPIILMALILFVISFVIGLILAIPFFVVLFPAVFALAIGQGQNWTPLLWAGLCLLAYLPLMILLRGILTTFTGCSWTLTFLRLTSAPGDNTPVVVEANA
jgi:hypothetical protein